MNSLDVINLRLVNQKLINPNFSTPQEIVHWLGAMQAQDFAAAKCAVSLRTHEQTDAQVERAFNEGLILRTHTMRPTWHFVTPEDIVWLQDLTSARVHAFNNSYYRKLGFDNEIFQKSNKILHQVLKGGKQLTREELNIYLKEAKIPTQDIRLAFVLMQAELEGLICSGPRKGKQFTYMLLEDRVKKYKKLTHEEALVELIKRYFQSHGPAQISDFVWWSGLTKVETQKGLNLLGNKINKQQIGVKDYYFFASTQQLSFSPSVYLLPGFDEYFIAYKDRLDVLDNEHVKYLNIGSGMIMGVVLINGKMAGSWRRVIQATKVVIKLKILVKITEEQNKALQLAAKKYGQFINLPVEIITN